MGAEKPVRAIALLSGGLDSILAARIVADQGVDVLALHFISPFFGADKRGREAEVEAFYRENYGIRVRVADVSEEFMRLLAAPRHGFGRNFNPCVDCKIFLFRKALETMEAEGAKFLVTGEVLGQRPMSQRRDTMNLIAKELKARDILLRPLCAKLMEPTLPEREGWVDREKLFDFSGRNRKPQMALAESLGIHEYPTPAGGCALTDPCLAARVRRYYDETPEESRSEADVRLLLAGRPFAFPGGSRLTLGRNQGENKAVLRLLREGDEVVRILGAPGPLGLFRPGPGPDERPLAASVMLRYCPKAAPGASAGFGPSPEETAKTVAAVPADPETLESWRR